ncbi:MAG TPA: LOG family protein [Armatimonadota bacterium]|jgi:hypothetical protein
MDELSKQPATKPAAAKTGQNNGDDALRRRMARVIKEYLRLDQELKEAENTNFRVCIFGSARIRRRDVTWQTVFRLARALAKSGIDVVTGGGPGLMEAANFGLREATKDSSVAHAMGYGLPLDIPSLREPANLHLDIKSAHQRFSTRLDEFMRLSHAVVVAPGGIGTLLELMYVWQLVQIGLIQPRPIILLDAEYWSGLLDWMGGATLKRALINPEDLNEVRLVSDWRDALAILEAAQHDFMAVRGPIPALPIPGPDHTAPAT